MLGPHDDPPPVAVSHPSLGPAYLRPTTEAVLSERLERELAQEGFIPLTCDPVTGALRLTSTNSVQVPKQFGRSEGGVEATLNHLLSTRFPYLLVACRIAHYLKVIDRDRLGVQRTQDEVESDLNDWLSQYVVDMDGASPAVRAQYPLRRASVSVKKADGSAGWYRVELRLRPHLKYLGSALTLSIAGRLERP
jgi:type VI secretion system protein ImpC